MNPKLLKLNAFKLLITLILVIGIFFRFANLDQKVYWIDEVHTSVRVSGYKKKEFVETAPTQQIITIQELQKFQRLTPAKNWNDTIQALAGNAEHAPLYYLITRLWMQWFGASPTVTRSLAAVISLLVFPALYWLCQELFASAMVGWIAIALVAVSPIQVLYAQEAREYTLWTLTILISSIALLKARKQENFNVLLQQERHNFNQSASDIDENSQEITAKLFERDCVLHWGLYAATVSFSLYSHLISILGIFGQGIYLLILDKFRITKSLISYSFACLAAIFSLIPWIILYFNTSSSIGEWVARKIPLTVLLQRWFLILMATFLDPQLAYPNQQLFDVETGIDKVQLSASFPLVAIGIFLIFLITYALYHLYRYTPKNVWLFILTLIGATGLILAIPDVISGGQRSSIARYLIPCYVGIDLAVAYLFAKQISNPIFKQWQRQLWRVLFVAIASLGILSCAVSSPAQTWWNKYSSYYNPMAANLINQSENALVISSQERVSRLTSLSYKLSPNVALLLVGEGQTIPPIPNNFNNIFLFRPAGELQQQIAQLPQYQLTAIYPAGHLWKLEQAQNSARP